MAVGILSLHAITMKPLEYRRRVQGFGTWRIAYVPAERTWHLSYNVRLDGERWTLVRTFAVAESAVLCVGKRETGVGEWDGLRFAIGEDFDLSTWQRDASEGVQEDAAESNQTWQ